MKKAGMLALGMPVVVALGFAPTAAATPGPPQVCYVDETSITARNLSPCTAPGSIQYQQGAHQPTYSGANPFVPYGVNPYVPYGTNQNNSNNN